MDVYNWLNTFFSDLHTWILLLPKWGMWCFILIGSNIFSRIGLFAGIGFAIIIWNAFGIEWGAISLVVSTGLVIIYIFLSSIFKSD